MNYQDSIEEIYQLVKSEENKGELASYIPELAKINSENFGIYLSAIDKYETGIGDYTEKFSVQSISKIFSLIMAYKLIGDDLWKRVGVEPSGTAFNSLVQLEADNGIPRNPFMNSGAIVICDILISQLKNPKQDVLEFIKTISNNSNISYSHKIVESERSVGHRNTALCHYH